jgi:hypothetical protein
MTNVASGSAKKAILGRFAAGSAVRFGLKENLSELFKRGVRGAICSGLLVRWESRAENFGRNLYDAIVSPFFIPLATGTTTSPEIWSKANPSEARSVSLAFLSHCFTYVCCSTLSAGVSGAFNDAREKRALGSDATRRAV